MKTSLFRFTRLAATSLGLFAFISSVGASQPAASLPTAWQQSKAIAGWNEADHYATDHIMVKRVGEPVRRVTVSSDSTVMDTVEYWQSQDEVEFAEPDNVVRALGQEASWGYDQIQAAAAGTTNSATGSGVIVGVVDTGVDYLHEDLDANNWVNTGETAGDGIDNDGNDYVDDYYGYDFIGSLYTSVDPDADPQDEAGHGTHVSGIIAAENNTVGVVGVAPSAQIMPVKVLDAGGYGWDSTIADGIRYAVDNGADVINLSLGSSFASNTIKSAIDYAETNNVLVVAAAGNSYTYTAPSYPAAYQTVVSVGSTNEDGFKSDFSNWGKVNVVAPGEEIYSSTPGDTYSTYSGTSMASPHVAGEAALIMQKQGLIGNPAAVRQILLNTADDFGTIAGNDYLSGYGYVNALDATGTQAASAVLTADSGTIKTDGVDAVTLTVSVRNSVNAPLAGQTVAWSTTDGTLSASSSTTGAAGTASVTLIADDVDGLVTITADPASTDATTIQLALLNDIPTIPMLGVYPWSAAEDTVLEPIDEETSEDVSSTGEDNVFAPGDEVVLWSYITERDLQTHDNVSLSYAVTDPNGDAVTELSGDSETLDVGFDFYGIFYIPQAYWDSVPVTIPEDAEAGVYTLTITVTENDSGETSSSSTTFRVTDNTAKVLLVDNDGYCSDAPIQGLSYGGVVHCMEAATRVGNALENLGYDVMTWNVTQLGAPYDAMLDYPVVVWLDATFTAADTTALQTYLDAGGNLLLSSEASAEYIGYYGASDFGWNYLHANYVSKIYEPDTVTGGTDGLFAGETYDIDPYNLESSGTHTNYSVDELTVNTDDDDAVPLFTYTDGQGDMAAGVQVATDTYRLIYTSFGIESINNSGDATLQHFLDTAVTWLRGTRPRIRSVGNHNFDNNSEQTITIHGRHFQFTGTTKVKLGKRQLDNVVVSSRTNITATVPAGMNPGRYKVKVINPDGRKVTKNQAVRIRQGDLHIDALSNSFGANNADRELTITGRHFNTNATVWLNGTQLTDVEITDHSSITATVPAGFTAGHYAVKVQNPNGDIAIKKTYTVRVGFSENLEKGDVSSQVQVLEKRLKNYSYFTGDPDTLFDGVTEEALVRYQTDNFLTASGKLDASTRYYLNNN